MILLTDGQNNADSGDTSKVPERIKHMNSKLHCLSFYVNIGGDVPRSRSIADSIDAKFFDAHSTDWERVAMDLSDKLAQIKPPTASKTSTSIAASPVHVIAKAPSRSELLFSRLPSVPTHSLDDNSSSAQPSQQPKSKISQ